MQPFNRKLSLEEEKKKLLNFLLPHLCRFDDYNENPSPNDYLDGPVNALEHAKDDVIPEIRRTMPMMMMDIHLLLVAWTNRVMD